MTNPVRCSPLIWCIRLRAASAALALTAVLLLVVVASQSAQAQTYTVLHRFRGGAYDGAYPYGGVVRDAKGNLYGTTSMGGSSDLGTVFKLHPTGKQTVLYTFTGGYGAIPVAGLLRDSAGNLYGTAEQSSIAGSVFKVSPTGKFTVLYTFTGGTDGGLSHGRFGAGHRRATFTVLPKWAESADADRIGTRAGWSSKWIQPVKRPCYTPSPEERTVDFPWPVWCGTRRATFTVLPLWVAKTLMAIAS